MLLTSFGYHEKWDRSMKKLIQFNRVDYNWIPKELTAEPYEVGNSQVRFKGKELTSLFRPGRTGHPTGRF